MQPTVPSTTMDKSLAPKFKEIAVRLTHRMSAYQRFLEIGPIRGLTIKLKAGKLEEMKQDLSEMYALLESIK